MLVDINLLPQKEKKRSIPLIFIILILFILIAVIWYSWFIYSQQVEVEKGLQQQLATTRQLSEMKQQNETKSASSDATEQLKNALAWAESYPMSTYTLLDHLASLLPERGFVLSFSLQEGGAIQLSIQFDSSREAAYYLKSLQDSKFVKEATLSTISTEPVEEIAESENSEGKVLPRYIAQYSLTIDEEAVKNAVTDEEDK